MPLTITGLLADGLVVGAALGIVVGDVDVGFGVAGWTIAVTGFGCADPGTFGGSDVAGATDGVRPVTDDGATGAALFIGMGCGLIGGVGAFM